MVQVALTIAGSDPSGGAGLQADLKTFHQHGCYGAAVVTLLTVQNTRRVTRVEVMSPALVGEQLDAVLEDMPPAAIKTGALGSEGVVLAVAERLAHQRCPRVIDPVMISKHGASLMALAAQQALAERLLPHATLVTPNAAEAEALSGIAVHDPDSAKRAAAAIASKGAQAVLVKGGHFAGEPIDVLWHGGQFTMFPGPRIESPHTHGVGCSLASAIAARLARGAGLVEAVAAAKHWVARGIASSPAIGGGICGIDHHTPVDGAPITSHNVGERLLP